MSAGTKENVPMSYRWQTDKDRNKTVWQFNAFI
jgi:hypothetical protein